MTNKQVRLASRPEGLPNDSNWSFDERPVPTPGDGEVLVKVSHISLDPAMRAWMNEGATYIEDVKVGDVMRANCVGEVVESRSPKLHSGDTVQGVLGVQQYALAAPKDLLKIDATLAPIQSYLGVLGWPGMTAYFGLLDIGKASAGETVVISGAAGAVGSVAGQIAKIKGCRVVGIAGGPDKCAYLIDELGFDGAIDYKNENIRNRLSELCPKRVDVFFDNVGGEILDAVLSKIAMHARIVISGAISQYNNPRFRGPNNYMALLTNRARMEGFVVFDYAKDCGAAAAEIAQWMAEGKLKAKEHVVEGIENFPSAFLRLFSGEKLGKLVLRV
ncbi:MAG: NADP-dependent oxidoreductase [Myxococcales bacterium]|nr:NADP-dependent oxidoreductase [Deltaproteobacteria bacterium]NNK07208.1 NADP-dependent oxidoreductase [Myxococcales bacterium]NNL26152.1 NADP-dependent oxidoreductase [Myxococcales bacterium]RZV52962.1 MAG: NADP-dependent oxidoreductase [Deltaproteobacteria bacterium]